MKTKLKKELLKSFILISFLFLSASSKAVVYSNLRVAVELVNPAGIIIPTTSSAPHTICVGDTLYIKNKFFHGCSGGAGIGGPGLVGLIDVITSTGTILAHYSVTNAPGGTWNYNEILKVPMPYPTGGTSAKYMQVKYWGAFGEVTYTTACPSGVDPKEDFLCYGRIMALPVLTATASPTAVCAGENVTLTANGATTYVWTPGGTGSTVNVAPSTTTVYTVTGTNGYGCTATKPVTVTVNPSPVVLLQNYSLCDLSHMPVLDGGNGGTSYVWRFDGAIAGFTQFMNTAFYGVGTYQVTVTNSFGCSTSATSIIQLDPTASPNTAFNYATTGSSLMQLSVTANVSNTNNSWELFNSNASGAMLSSIEAFSFPGGGNSYTFSTLISRNAYYRVNHIASSNPCLNNGTSWGLIYITTRGEIEIIDNNTNDRIESFKFSSYPNPSNGVINIQTEKTKNEEIIQLCIFNMVGEQITEKLICIPGNQLMFDLSNQPNGIYLLKGIQGNEVVTKKIIKQ